MFDGSSPSTSAPPLGPVVRATVRVEVKDHQGNVTRVARTFATVAAGIFADGFESGDLSAWSLVVP